MFPKKLDYKEKIVSVKTMTKSEVMTDATETEKGTPKFHSIWFRNFKREIPRKRPGTAI